MDPTTLTFTVNVPGSRVDIYLAEQMPAISRSKIQALIKEGRVLVNDQQERASYRVEAGDLISVDLPPEPVVEAENISLDVLYEDSDLVIINKAAGMVVHPAHGHMSGTLVNAALARWPQMAEVGGIERAGVVHRIDKDTSGLIVLAKTLSALAHLQAQFQKHQVYKRYYALVEGVPLHASGIIDAPIGRDPEQRKRMAVLHSGRRSLTHYEVLEDFGAYALLSVEIKTGRTHQIRVHLSWLGYPVVGDQVYGRRKVHIPLKRFFLHAADLRLVSPSTSETLSFNAPLPTDLTSALDWLRSRPGVGDRGTGTGTLD